ncbi:MAG: AAA family ATPase [Anaerolineae bacterium]
MPALIIIGGFAGTGKTAISRRLSVELNFPRLGSDTLGRTIKNSVGIKKGEVDAYWIAYELLFRLSEEFIQAGVSTILDLTMGWEFQWQHVDNIICQYPKTLFLPLILRCSYEQCIERVRQRHKTKSDYYDPVEVYTTEPKNIRIWEFLAQLNRPDIYFVDASQSPQEVYETVKEYVLTQLTRKAQTASKLIRR